MIIVLVLTLVILVIYLFKEESLASSKLSDSSLSNCTSTSYLEVDSDDSLPHISSFSKRTIILRENNNQGCKSNKSIES